MGDRETLVVDDRATAVRVAIAISHVRTSATRETELATAKYKVRIAGTEVPLVEAGVEVSTEPAAPGVVPAWAVEAVPLAAHAVAVAVEVVEDVPLVAVGVDAVVVAEAVGVGVKLVPLKFFWMISTAAVIRDPASHD